MAGLAILTHTYDLSDEVVCELWLENPYYQCFCGEELFRHRLPFDRCAHSTILGASPLSPSDLPFMLLLDGAEELLPRLGRTSADQA
jgi:hypothetical protein